MEKEISVYVKNPHNWREKLIKVIRNGDIAVSKSSQPRIASVALFCAHQSELESAYVIRVLICCQ